MSVQLIPGVFKHPPFPVFRPGSGELVAARDWLGNTFAVGDVVLYCVGADRGQMMAVGRVVKLEIPELGYDAQRAIDSGREVRREVCVQVLTAKTSGHWGNGPRTRPAWVNPMNITALPPRPVEWFTAEAPALEPAA